MNWTAGKISIQQILHKHSTDNYLPLNGGRRIKYVFYLSP